MTKVIAALLIVGLLPGSPSVGEAPLEKEPVHSSVVVPPVLEAGPCVVVPGADQGLTPCQQCRIICAELQATAAAICARATTPVMLAACIAAEIAAITYCDWCATEVCGGGGENPLPPGEDDECPSGHYSNTGLCCDEWGHIPIPGGGFAEYCIVHG